MSVSKYAYEEWKCGGEYCCGDCDHCYKRDLQKPKEIEQDGFITPERYLKHDN